MLDRHSLGPGPGLQARKILSLKRLIVHRVSTVFVAEGARLTKGLFRGLELRLLLTVSHVVMQLCLMLGGVVMAGDEKNGGFLII